MFLRRKASRNGSQRVSKQINVCLCRCPYLHRVAGDVERRYHLRYYKTAICVHETDSRGFCVKNGPHCAFAHGPHDLRQPVYDVRELQAMERDEAPTELGLQAPESKVQLEDPRWQGWCERKLFRKQTPLSPVSTEIHVENFGKQGGKCRIFNRTSWSR